MHLHKNTISEISSNYYQQNVENIKIYFVNIAHIAHIFLSILHKINIMVLILISSALKKVLKSLKFYFDHLVQGSCILFNLLKGYSTGFSY